MLFFRGFLSCRNKTKLATMANIINDFSNSNGLQFTDHFNATSEKVYATFRSLEVSEASAIKFGRSNNVIIYFKSLKLN